MTFRRIPCCSRIIYLDIGQFRDLSLFRRGHPCAQCNLASFHGKGEKGRRGYGPRTRRLLRLTGERIRPVFRAIKITANRNYRRINRVITTPLMPRIGARAPHRAASLRPDNGKYRYRGCNWHTGERVTRRCNSSAQLRARTLNSAWFVPTPLHRVESTSTVSRVIRRAISLLSPVPRICYEHFVITLWFVIIPILLKV